MSSPAPSQADQALAAAGQALEGRRFNEVERLCRQLIALAPTDGRAYQLWGLAAYRSGNHKAAAPLFYKACEYRPGVPGVRHLLGITLRRLNALPDAIAAFRDAARLAPDVAEYQASLGEALLVARDLPGARIPLQRAVRLKAGYAAAHRLLGHYHGVQKEYGQAIDCYRKAVELDPNDADAWLHLALAAGLNDQASLALEAFDKAVQLAPHDARLRHHYADHLLIAGRTDEAIDQFRRALQSDFRRPALQSDLLFALNYSDRLTDDQVFTEHRQWGTAVEWQAGDVAPHENVPDPARRLRVGYLSPDFREHAVWLWLRPILRHHDRARFDVYCYSNVQEPDSFTEDARALASTWRDVSSFDDDRAAALIREDRIDVLIDLAGHTSHNRLRVLARKPSPVQATYLGYPNTTGLSRIDWIVTDDLLDPPGQSERLYAERLLRLPHCFSSYSPRDDDHLDVSPLPALRNGHVTFASFNYLPKISPSCVRLWAALLKRVENSRLLLKSDFAADEGLRQRVRSLFAGHGLDAERVELLPWQPSHAEHLASYARVDIALDTVPYNGTTTTCESVWMGVPVISLAGTSRRARVGLSLLSAMGMGDWVAHTEDQFIDIGVKLASGLDQLAGLRAELRDRMRSSRLLDGKAFTADYERALVATWEDYCAKRATP